MFYSKEESMEPKKVNNFNKLFAVLEHAVKWTTFNVYVLYMGQEAYLG
jgi:hypothetical protein